MNDAIQPLATVIHIDIANEQRDMAVDEPRIRAAVRAALACGSVADARVSVAIVDDEAIHDLNRRHLGHDYPTDVLSYRLDEVGGAIEGEIVVSGATAARSAQRFAGWSAGDELLLYVTHGALHLVGFDDQSSEALAQMRDAERSCLAQLGLSPPYDDDASESSAADGSTAEAGKETAS